MSDEVLIEGGGSIPGLTVRPRRSAKSLPAKDDGELITPDSRRFLALCDGSLTLRQLAAASALGEFEAIKAAYKLLGAGYLVIEEDPRR